MKVVGRVVIVRNLSSCQRAIELPQVIDKQKVFVFSICLAVLSVAWAREIRQVGCSC